MQVTATRNEERFEPIELKIVIESQEEFDMWYKAADGDGLDNLIGRAMSYLVFNQLKQFKE